MYIKISTGEYPVYENQIRESVYPAALPYPLTEQIITQLGYKKVLEVDPENISKKPWDYLVEGVPIPEGSYCRQNWQLAELTLGEKKSRMLSHFNEVFNQLISQVKISYPPTEVESWAKQEKEAREYLADNSSAATIVRAIALARGVPVQILAQKIVDKADQYGQVVGTLIGTRQMLEDQIQAATEETIDSINWP